MRLSKEKKALLDAHWQVLRDHYVWHASVRRIALDCGMTERRVRSIIVQAWQACISEEMVRHYLKTI